MEAALKPITLTTDFGLTDNYVGVVKGVILTIASNAQIVDICHEIQPWDIRSAAWIVENTFRYFPPQSVHVAVVDPGVGSIRRPVLLTSNEGSFVGPDNGVFSFACRSSTGMRAYHLTNREFWLPEVSSTFQARDIFAPVAAHFASAVPAERLGEEIDVNSLVSLPQPELSVSGAEIRGEVVYIDRFGNLVTNIPVQELTPGGVCILDEAPVGELYSTYSSVEAGSPAAIAGSHGFLEIGVNQGSAKNFFSYDPGKPVAVRYIRGNK